MKKEEENEKEDDTAIEFWREMKKIAEEKLEKLDERKGECPRGD